MGELGSWMKEHELLLFAIGIVVVNFVWLMLCRKKLNIRWYAALLIALLHDVVGYTAMRLLAIIEVGGDISRAANMRLFGAVFVLPLLYCLWARFFKHDKALVMDIAAICLSVGLIFGRVNCLFSGCCAGTLIPGSAVLHWPLRETELVYYGLFIAWYAPKILRGQTKGEAYPVFMISYGVLRFILEWFRVEYSGFGVLHFGTIWSIISIMMGLSIYFSQREKERNKKGRVQKK